MLSPYQIAVIALAGAAFAAGWAWRADIAEADMAQFKDGIAQQAADQRELKANVEASQTAVTQQSSQRLNQQAEKQQEAIQYVDREVVVFRDRWRNSACRLPDEWVSIYRSSLGLGGSMPEADKAR